MKPINMKTSLIRTFILTILFSSLMASCKETDDLEKNSITVSKSSIVFPEEGGTNSFVLETDAEAWSIDNPASAWLNVATTAGTKASTLIALSVEGRTTTAYTDSLLITAGNADPVYLVVSQPASEYLYNLSHNRVYFEFSHKASSANITITSEAPLWNLSCAAEWISFSEASGGVGTFNVAVNAARNVADSDRADTIYLSADGGPSYAISVTQNAGYPDYNTDPIAADETGMTSTAIEIAANMTLGWNLGNTLEAMGGETAWGNPKVTKELIQAVKAQGFNAVRLPCSWDQFSDQNTAEIDESWLARVKEVIQYCVDEDLYVLLNIHWDGGWLEENCTSGARVENNAKQKAFWHQIATYMRDFDEHLLFASANEPNVDDASGMAVLLSYHQTFIDAVRETGGKNAYRVLVVQGPGTDMEKTNNLMNTLPTDEVEDKLMVEVHYYSPWNFCGLTEDASWGSMFYYWGEPNLSTTDTDRNPSWGDEAFMESTFELMKLKFAQQGIPVILGEFGAIRRTGLTGDVLTKHEDSRAYFNYYLVKTALANGMIPFYWDEGSLTNNGFGLMDRSDNTVFDTHIMEALLEGAAK